MSLEFLHTPISGQPMIPVSYTHLTQTPESSLIAYKEFTLHEVNPNNGLGITYFDFDPNVFPPNMAGIASVGGGIFYMIG